jgi:hypothetical protein
LELRVGLEPEVIEKDGYVCLSGESHAYTL